MDQEIKEITRLEYLIAFKNEKMQTLIKAEINFNVIPAQIVSSHDNTETAQLVKAKEMAKKNITDLSVLIRGIDAMIAQEQKKPGSSRVDVNNDIEIAKK